MWFLPTISSRSAAPCPCCSRWMMNVGSSNTPVSFVVSKRSREPKKRSPPRCSRNAAVAFDAAEFLVVAQQVRINGDVVPLELDLAARRDFQIGHALDALRIDRRRPLELHFGGLRRRRLRLHDRRLDRRHDDLRPRRRGAGKHQEKRGEPERVDDRAARAAKLHEWRAKASLNGKIAQFR
jgi:hypothetical protein